MKRLEVLFEDEDILVCIKPLGVPSQADKTRDIDMVTLAKKHIFDQEGQEGEPYVGLVHRLDRPVGGIMVFAKNQDAAADLSGQMLDGVFHKSYQAVLTGELREEGGRMTDYLLRDGKTNTSKVVPKGTKGAKKAELDYEVLDVIETDQGILSFVLIELITGRHHQIRVQCASRGVGIYGDTKYNPLFKDVKKNYKQIGLYASRIEFEHPSTKELLVFKAEPVGEAFDLIDVEEI
ncbi:MAG: RluA family pseudouridine synthase [Lachnospiraceae bacterium]|nr:RluA family pseudouridine synthase [Lachnospiraceae bacterium]